MNYQKEMENLIAEIQKAGEVPSLLLHSCCAPCSSYVLEYLSDYFKITVFFYNPNIFPEEEYTRRIVEQQDLIAELKVKNPILFMAGEYERTVFSTAVKGLEKEKEGGKRCRKCFELRLREAAVTAAEGGYDFYTTTLSISPLKNVQALNELGVKIGEEYGVRYLMSDFKKKNGFKRSLELSKEHHLYRQDYCGCEFSVRKKD